jgi:hypothetical protein
LIHDAQKYGARIALFGRKINNAEHQLAFIEMLRLITDQKISPEEAVRAYHGVLQAEGITPKLPLEKDLELTDQSMSYDGSSTRRATIEVRSNPLQTNRSSAPVTANSISGDWPKLANGAPDFSKMDPLQRLAYDQVRLRKKFG